MAQTRREYEEKLLERIIETDGIKKIQDAITAVISGTPDVNVTDRVARLLGIVYGNLDQLKQQAVTKELLAWINNFPTDYPDSAVLQKLAGTLTYSDETITKTVENRDADGYITSIEYYAGTTLKFTLTITRDANKRITSIERT